MSEPNLVAPRMFISYSWSNSEHEEWVISLAEELRNQGIDVILDKWDLKPGHNAFAFMEQMVLDATVTKVLLICDRKYSEKSNAREGGAGTEAQIITPEIYAKKSQDKYAAVVRERDDQGQPYLPVYYKGRIFIDLSDDSIYAIEFEKLVRWAWDKPINIKPPLGKPPSFVTEQAAVKLATSVPFRRAVEAIKSNRTNAVPATVEYLDTVVSEMEAFRIAATPETLDTFDDVVVKSIGDFLPYRNELIELFTIIASYRPDEEMVEASHRFFERLMPFTQMPENVASSFQSDQDNFLFIIHELFLYCVASFIKHERFTQAAFFLDKDFYYADRFSNETMRNFLFFRFFPRSLAHRNQRLSLGRFSLQADFLKERSGQCGVQFKYLELADFMLYLRSQRSESVDAWWWPVTLVFISFRSRLPFEIFARAKSARYFERVKVLLGITGKDHLEALVSKLEAAGDQRVPRYGFDQLNPRQLLALDAIATSP